MLRFVDVRVLCSQQFYNILGYSVIRTNENIKYIITPITITKTIKNC